MAADEQRDPAPAALRETVALLRADASTPTVGARFGLLTVLEILGGHALCRCACGALTKPTLWALRNRPPQSCNAGVCRARVRGRKAPSDALVLSTLPVVYAHEERAERAREYAEWLDHVAPQRRERRGDDTEL